jgi:predicted nucleic acid-binding protein
MPIEIVDENLLVITERIRDIAAGCTDSALDHLGEAASIAMLQSVGSGRLISDDHGARADTKRGVHASSTVGVIAQLLGVMGSGVDPVMADLYLQTLRVRKRMYAALTSTDLLAGDLGPWQ